MRASGFFTFILSIGLITLTAQSPARQPYTTWSDYGGSADSMQYSALKQITKSNVAQLQRAWFYPVPDRTGSFGFNPLVVDDVMYVLGQKNSIIALDAATGTASGRMSPEGGSPGARGINYWESNDRSDRRLIFGAGGTLREIDARTGNAITSFGDNGRVNMRVGDLRPLGGPSGTAGRVFENLFMTGSMTGEGYGSPPGDLRAFDVVTGKLVWTFHTIPYPGEFGYDTWPEGACKWAGGVNTWGEISIDESRGIAYFPLGSPTHDMLRRRSSRQQSLRQLARSRSMRAPASGLWHFQTVHHDIWDYDLTTGAEAADGSPQRKDRSTSSRKRPRTGFVFVFDRVTGEPLWPIEERPVPQSDVPGEKLSPTQPYPTKPPPFARQEVGARGYQSVSRRVRVRARCATPQERAQRRVVHAADARPRADLRAGRVRRIELGRRCRRSRDRLALRAHHRHARASQTARAGRLGSGLQQRRRQHAGGARPRGVSELLRSVSRAANCQWHPCLWRIGIDQRGGARRRSHQGQWCARVPEPCLRTARP